MSPPGVIVVGSGQGGFIGLEVAVIGKAMRLDVQVIEFAERVLKRCMSAEVACYLADALAKLGVQFSFETDVTAFTGSEGRVTVVQTSQGDPASGKFSVFRFRAGRLAAVESMNNAADHMAACKLLAAATPITPDQVADPSLKLATLLAP